MGDHPTRQSDDESGTLLKDAATQVGIDTECSQSSEEHLLDQIGMLEQLLDATTKRAKELEDQVREQECLLEEKSDVIRELHVKLQAAQNPHDSGASVPSERELLELTEELEQERQQLKQDEETLMKQMREMEIQMSRERADLARQRSELQRLHSEIRHELETAQRESELRDRLQPLQRRYQDLAARKGAAPARPAEEPSGLASTQAPPPPTPQERSSGIFRRLFG